MQGDSCRKPRQRAAWCSQELGDASVHRVLDFRQAMWGRNLLRSHLSWTSASRTTDKTFSTPWAVQCGHSVGTALETNSGAIRWREMNKNSTYMWKYVWGALTGSEGEFWKHPGTCVNSGTILCRQRCQDLCLKMSRVCYIPSEAWTFDHIAHVVESSIF